MRCGEYSSTPARLPWGRRKTEGLEGWEAVRLGRFQPDPAGAGVPSPRHWERVRHQVSMSQAAGGSQDRVFSNSAVAV